MSATVTPLFPQACPGVEFPPQSLDELRRIEPDAVPWHNLEPMIAVYALIESDSRRMNAGPEGILEGAVQNWLIFAARQIAAARLSRRILFLWDCDMIEHLVRELTAEMQRSAKLKRELLDGLKHSRDIVWRNAAFSNDDPSIIPKNKDEDVIRTYVRTLDYISEIQSCTKRSSFIDLKRECLSCLRAINAVFATDY